MVQNILLYHNDWPLGVENPYLIQMRPIRDHLGLNRTCPSLKTLKNTQKKFFLVFV